MEDFSAIHAELKAHQLNDSLEFGKAEARDNEILARIENLATKEDVAGVISFYKNMLLAEKIATGAGRWGYRTIIFVAALIGAVAVIFGGAKALVAWALAHTIESMN